MPNDVPINSDPHQSGTGWVGIGRTDGPLTPTRLIFFEFEKHVYLKKYYCDDKKKRFKFYIFHNV